MSNHNSIGFAQKEDKEVPKDKPRRPKKALQDLDQINIQTIPLNVQPSVPSPEMPDNEELSQLMRGMSLTSVDKFDEFMDPIAMKNSCMPLDVIKRLGQKQKNQPIVLDLAQENKAHQLDKIQREEQIKKIAQLLNQKYKTKLARPEQWARMCDGNWQQTQRFIVDTKADPAYLISDKSYTAFKKLFLKSLLTKMFRSAHMQSQKDYMMTHYGALQHIFDQFAKEVPALHLALYNKRKILMQVAAEQWFYGLDVSDDRQYDDRYMQGLSSFANTDSFDKVRVVMGSDDSWEDCLKYSFMGQNSIKTSIRIYLEGTRHKTTKFSLQQGTKWMRGTPYFQLSILQEQTLQDIREWQEQPFVYRWLNSDKNRYLKFLITADQNYLRIYTLSMKYVCPNLYKVLVKQRTYIWRIIKIDPTPKYQGKTDCIEYQS